MQNHIEIPLSKTKIFFLELLSIAFVVISIWIFNSEAVHARYNPYIAKTIGIVGVLFFGATSIFGFKKLFDNKPGLILQDEGFIDNSNALSIGMVYWSDIKSIKVLEISSSKLLMINVKNPEYYIDQGKSAWKKRLMKLNHKYYSSPISIPANSLKISFKELEILMKTEWEKTKNIG